MQFNITSPTEIDLAIHQDGFRQYGGKLVWGHVYKYNNINFKEIAEATRNQLIFQIKLIVYKTSTIDLYLI